MDGQADARERAGADKAPPTNLPIGRGRLIGREHDLARARRLLLSEDVGLLTLTGVGGSGKSRPALRLAADVRDRFADGVFFVELAPIRDPSLVPVTVARVLGLEGRGDAAIADVVTAFFRARRILLVLDNCEHLPEVARWVRDVLAVAPDVKVLATSRAPLRLREEHEFPVLPLALPDASWTGSAEELGAYPSVELFATRVRATRPEFQVTDDNAPSVADICVRLDGLPLAIELAAARCRMLSPSELLRRLEYRLPVLIRGHLDLPERQRSLRDAIGWSFDLLPDAERRLFRRLGVFVGGWTLDAAAAVCDFGDRACLDSLAELADQSLVRRVSDPAGDGRFGMLETVREFAVERLQESGEVATIRRRHLRWCVRVAEQACEAFYGPDAVAWLDRLAADYDNVRAALAWSLADDDPASAEEGLRLAGSLLAFWYSRSYLREGRRWLEQVLARAGHAPHADDGRGGPAASSGAEPELDLALDHDPRRRHQWGRAPLIVALNALTLLASDQQQLDLAEWAARTALDLARRAGDVVGQSYALGALGRCTHARGEVDRAIVLHEEALAVVGGTGDLAATWRANNALGTAVGDRGELERAGRLHEEALAVARTLGCPWQVASSLRELGLLAYRGGKLEDAARLLEESLVHSRLVGSTRGPHRALMILGAVALDRGDVGGASTHFHESLTLCQEAGDAAGIARCLEGLADAWASRREDGASPGTLDAATLFGAAAALRRTIGVPVEQGEAPSHRRAVAATRAALGNAAFQAAWARGQAMSADEAVVYARNIGHPEHRSEAGAAPTRPARERALLTPRERDIVALLARGRTNRQIAESLVTSERTVEAHTRNIREKLALKTRAQLIAWAVEQRLTVAGTRGVSSS